MKDKLFTVYIVFLYLVFSGHLMAGDVDKKAKELSSIKTKIKEIKQEVQTLELDRQTLQRELKKLEIKNGQNVKLLLSLNQQVEGLNNTLATNEQQQQIKQQQIKAQKKGLEKLVKAAHGMGVNEKLKIMLNQEDPAVSGRIMVYYDLFNKSRLEKIAAIDRDLLVLRDLEKQHHDESKLLQEKLVVQKQRQMVLQQAKTERNTILSKINKQVLSKKQQLKRFKQSEKKLASLILKLQQQVKDDFPLNEGIVKPFVKLKGKLPWPVKGKVAKKFGDRRSESRWDGVLIEAKEGRKVRAITRGQVVYADWLRGYGLLTIIKHDNSYMTLYAFNQSLYKAKGDWVEAGTIISTVGVSGGRSKAGLYFGVRKKGKPINPVKWCKKIRNGKIR